MNGRIQTIIDAVRLDSYAWLVWSIALTALFYVAQLISLIIRFEHFPNYFTVHNWFESVVTIVQSTPSLVDILNIVSEEWFLEIGYMNYDFGTGISEWSLFIAPVKVMYVFFLAAAFATYFSVRKANKAACSLSSLRFSNVATGFGATLAALTSLTMSWVVCCSTPTWVVGLAMLGLGASTSLWIEPIGIWLKAVGLCLLMVAIWLTAKSPNAENQELPPRNRVREKLKEFGV